MKEGFSTKPARRTDRWSTGLKWMILLLLGSFTVIYGVVPAWTDMHSDFPNYYVSARLLMEGEVVQRLYNDPWFNEKIQEYGIDQAGKFSPFPPVTAFVMMPLAHLAPMTAKRFWTLMNLALLAGIVYLLNRITSWGLLNSINFMLLSGMGLVNNFRFGQLYLLVLFWILLGYRLWKTQQPYKGGFLLGLGASLKYLPLVYLVAFAINRKWRMAFAGMTTIACITLMEVLVFGPTFYRHFLADVLWPHLGGQISSQDPYAIQFQSFSGLLRHVFVFDAGANPTPPINWPTGYEISMGLMIVVVSGLVLNQVYRLHRRGHRNRLQLDLALLGIAAMVLLPATATYHFLLLAFPLSLLMTNINGEGATKHLDTVYCSVYGAIGFVTIIPLTRIDHSGWKILLAYPRAWLMAILFSLALWTVAREGRLSPPRRT